MNQQDNDSKEAKGITPLQTWPTEVISTHWGVALIKKTFIVRETDIAHLLLGAKDISTENKEGQGDETATQ